MSDRLAEIRARLADATPGPWKVGEWNGEVFVARADGTALWDDHGTMDRRADADFIAHARTDVAFLLAENARLRAAAPRAA